MRVENHDTDADCGAPNLPAAARTARPIVVTSNYPTVFQPNWGTFVAALVNRWAALGADAHVVAPHPYWSARTRRFVLRYPPTDGARPATSRPGYWSFSNLRLGPISTARWTQRAFTAAVARGLRGIHLDGSVFYGHFLYPAGLAALETARRHRRPAVVALGESGFDHWDVVFGHERTRATLHAMAGILSVSEENKRGCIEKYDVPEDRIVVLPNAVDTDTFRPTDRERARRRLRLPSDRPIVAFTGHFVERKGPLRLLRAIAPLEGVGAVFLGDGPQVPEGPSVLFAGRVAHADVPEWLSAADLFVLPTTSEGSPNAVIEAMACGLPVVSYDIPALRETVDTRCARLVPSADEHALRGAIADLVYDRAVLSKMSCAAIERATRFTLEDRAIRVLAWLGGIIADHDRGI